MSVPGNFNSMRHGLRAAKLPKGCSWLEGQLKFFRRALEAELAAAGDRGGIYSSALVQSTVRHETRAQLAARWLRIQGDELSLADRLQLLATISAATDARDKCLERLKLDRDRKDNALEALYASPGRPGVDREAEADQESSGGNGREKQSQQPEAAGSAPPVASSSSGCSSPQDAEAKR